MAHAPGEKAVYSAAGINLLGSVLQHATGRWLPDLIQEEFAAPLGIRHYHLPLGASKVMPTWLEEPCCAPGTS